MADPRELVQLLAGAYNGHDADALARLYSPEAEAEIPGGQVFRSREALVHHSSEEWNEYPDARVDTNRIMVDGPTAVWQYTWSATNTNPLRMPSGETISPTGRTMVLPCITVLETKDGLVRSTRSYWDNMEAFAQLGLLPAAST